MIAEDLRTTVVPFRGLKLDYMELRRVVMKEVYRRKLVSKQLEKEEGHFPPIWEGNKYE